MSSAWPYPVDSGKRVVLSGLVEHLSSRVRQGGLHYVHVGRPPAQAGEVPFTVHRIAPPAAAEQLANLAVRTVLRRDRSVQESMLLGRRTGRELQAVLTAIGPALQVFDTVRMAQYAPSLPPGPGVRRVVYLDDLFSVRYARMLEAMAEHPDADLNVLGEFAAVVPGPLRVLVRHRRVQQAVLQLERRLVARSEDRAARGFERSLLVNELETALLVERAGTSRVATVAPLLRSAARQEPRPYHGRPEFVFLGLLTLPHNDAAIRSFLVHQMPELVRLRPDVRLRIVGRGAAPELRHLAAGFGDAVSLEGWVEDLDALLGRAAALVNPLLFGTGIKLKGLEALSRGVPVVSTRTGAEGIATGPEQGCVVEDDLRRHPALLCSLTDLETNRRLSEAALAHYRLTFSREAVQRRYDQVLPVSGTPG